MTPRPQPDDVEARVWAFEAAFAGGAKPDLAAFLPPPDAPHFLAVLRELACVELERAAARGERRTAVDYLDRFPALAADPEAVAALVRQEGRAGGATAVPASGAADWRAAVDALYADHRAKPPAGTAVVDSLELADLLLDSDPLEPTAALPQPGDAFLGFRLVRELGRGAFGRVFLAEQTDLAARPVALKVGAMLFDESRALAQLQHSNVVPIYSAHRAGGLQALCMPYLGATTLADVIDQFRRGSGGGAVWTTLAARAASTLKADEPTDAPHPERPPPPAVLEALRTMSHPREVTWLGARLADGLAHAHERGVLHRDIKPANVLVADDGTPLLLDFNLSGGAAGSVPAALGGTLPYMAPEHLEAFRGGPRPVDERSDIFALGVVLYELLTGRHPFPSHTGPLREQVPLMAADRRAGAPPAGTQPALDAILKKCLAPEPADRYQTARALHEDLQRQFDDRPLRHAREPLGRARVAKFARRNRRPLALAFGAALLLALAAVGGLAWLRSDRAARADALVEFARFRDESRDAEVLLALPFAEDAAEGTRLARTALGRFGLPDRTDWERAPAFAKLPPAEREEVRAAVPRLLLKLAAGERVLAVHAPVERAARDGEALRLNARAAELGGDRHKRAADLQRAMIEKNAWRPDDAGRLFVGGSGAVLAALDAATRAEPGDAALWADRGAVALALARPNDAVGSFSAVLALRPQVWRALVWRARAYYDLNDFPRARADLDAALARTPDDVPTLVLRGLTLFRLGEHAAAEADLTRALERGTTVTRVYFIRARVRAARGDAAGSAADHAEGLKRTPTDELSWVARGVARQASDPNGALSDFAAALALNPLSREAAQNTAATLSEFLGKPEEAVAVLDKLLDTFPDFVDARVGRAVLLARLGRRGAAHADAVAAVKLDRTGPTLYRAGCAYALTAKTHPGDRAEAFKLVTAALLDGFGASYVPVDDDLNALKADAAEFARLLKLAADTRPKK